MPDSHLFVIRGDLTHLACDAWMLPTSRVVGVRESWLGVPGIAEGRDTLRNGPFGRGQVRVAAWPDWDERPLPIATSVGSGILEPEQVDEPLADFIRLGARAARERNAREGLPDDRRVLLGIPFFGERGGGGGFIRGRLLSRIMDVGARVAREEDVDIALVLRDPRPFALAQVIRRENFLTHWPLFNARPELLSAAERLGSIGLAQRLVPFMGAGVSVSAGAPTWPQLISGLVAKAGISDTELAALQKPERDVLDQALYLRAVFKDRARVGDDDGFGKAIVDLVSLDRYGLAPALLANLDSDEAITLNYDQLFELAAEDAATPRTVIPDGIVESTSKWLLKLHGSVTNPDSIVLTRDDYLGYSTNREALSAIVKATLITHHLLFVGFGLQDDHFHQIIHDVRRAVPPGLDPRGGIATALTLFHDPLDEKLWAGQLQLVAMGEKGESVESAARTLEIFLDAVTALSMDSHSFLLAKGYEDEGGRADASLRSLLLEFADAATDDDKSTDSWRIVQRMLDDLGFDPGELLDRRARRPPPNGFV